MLQLAPERLTPLQRIRKTKRELLKYLQSFNDAYANYFFITCQELFLVMEMSFFAKLRQYFLLFTCSCIVAEMIMLFLRSPTRNMNVGRPFRGAMTAFLEKMSVSARRLAWAVFMNTQPSMTALMIRPKMFWMIRTTMASGHSSVTIRPPKPIVTWRHRAWCN